MDLVDECLANVLVLLISISSIAWNFTLSVYTIVCVVSVIMKTFKNTICISLWNSGVILLQVGTVGPVSLVSLALSVPATDVQREVKIFSEN